MHPSVSSSVCLTPKNLVCNHMVTWVGISGTTAESRKRKFVPSSHTGPFAVVASSRKSQTKVGTLSCFDFCKRMSKLCKNPRMLFHVDMIYLAKQAKRDVENARTGFLQFYVKMKRVCRCFASFSSEHEHFTHDMYMTALICLLNVKKSNRSCSMKE